MLHSQENEDAAVPEYEKKGLSDVRREKCNETEVPAETFHDEHFAEVNGSYKLADIISGWRTGSSLSTKLH